MVDGEVGSLGLTSGGSQLHPPAAALRGLRGEDNRRRWWWRYHATTNTVVQVEGANGPHQPRQGIVGGSREGQRDRRRVIAPHLLSAVLPPQHVHGRPDHMHRPCPFLRESGARRGLFNPSMSFTLFAGHGVASHHDYEFDAMTNTGI